MELGQVLVEPAQEAPSARCRTARPRAMGASAATRITPARRPDAGDRPAGRGSGPAGRGPRRGGAAARSATPAAAGTGPAARSRAEARRSALQQVDVDEERPRFRDLDLLAARGRRRGPCGRAGGAAGTGRTSRRRRGTRPSRPAPARAAPRSAGRAICGGRLDRPDLGHLGEDWQGVDVLWLGQGGESTPAARASSGFS